MNKCRFCIFGGDKTYGVANLAVYLMIRGGSPKIPYRNYKFLANLAIPPAKLADGGDDGEQFPESLYIYTIVCYESQD